MVLHQQTVRKAGAEARKERREAEEAFLEGRKETSTQAEKKRLERIRECGAWLTTSPTTFDGNVISKEE